MAYIIIIIIITPSEFFIQTLADSLLLESEWQQVSGTLFSILADFDHAIVWMVSASPPIFNSSNLLI